MTTRLDRDPWSEMTPPMRTRPDAPGRVVLQWSEGAFVHGLPATQLAAPTPLAFGRRLGVWWPADLPVPAPLRASLHHWLRLGGMLAWEGALDVLAHCMRAIPYGHPGMHRYHFGGRMPSRQQLQSRLTDAGTSWVRDGLAAHLADPSLWAIVAPTPHDLDAVLARGTPAPQLRRLVWETTDARGDRPSVAAVPHTLEAWVALLQPAPPPRAAVQAPADLARGPAT